MNPAAWVACLAIAASMQSAQAEVKRSIAVAPIQWSAGAVSWVTGEALQAQMISELNKSGRYRVVERENLQGMLNEQDIGAAGRTRGGSGPKVGDLEGAQMMIKCVVTDAEEKASSGASGSVFGIGGGGKKTFYKLTMDVRIYDTQTGLIADTATVSAEQEKKKKKAGVNLGIVQLGKEDSGGDTTGEITRELIRKALAAVDKQADVLGWTSSVFTVKGDKIIIRGGERDGLEPGMKFKVFALGEALVDEDTGEVLDEGEETEVGEIELTKVKEKIAYAKSTSGDTPEKGNKVKLISN